MTSNIKAIAFDADDTLWDNETYFKQVEADMCRLLSPYGNAANISESLFKTEMSNMADYGYGAMAFTLSLIQNAIQVSHSTVPAETIAKIIELGRTLLRLDCKPFEGVVPTLQALRDQGRYKLVVFTKGELITQENKLKRSGLTTYFDKVKIVSDKHETEYLNLCNELSITPDQLLMVGNSFRSDILPAINIGSWAVHIPFNVMWQHEVVETFDHERLFTISHFSELLKVINNS